MLWGWLPLKHRFNNPFVPVLRHPCVKCLADRQSQSRWLDSSELCSQPRSYSSNAFISPPAPFIRWQDMLPARRTILLMGHGSGYKSLETWKHVNASLVSRTKPTLYAWKHINAFWFNYSILKISHSLGIFISERKGKMNIACKCICSSLVSQTWPTLHMQILNVKYNNGNANFQ